MLYTHSTGKAKLGYLHLLGQASAGSSLDFFKKASRTLIRLCKNQSRAHLFITAGVANPVF
jgi:hypothetical protein